MILRDGTGSAVGHTEVISFDYPAPAPAMNVNDYAAKLAAVTALIARDDSPAQIAAAQFAPIDF